MTARPSSIPEIRRLREDLAEADRRNRTRDILLAVVGWVVGVVTAILIAWVVGG